MHEEFEKTVEFVGKEVNRAGLCFWDKVFERQGKRGFFASRKGYVLKIAMAIRYLYDPDFVRGRLHKSHCFQLGEGGGGCRGTRRGYAKDVMYVRVPQNRYIKSVIFSLSRDTNHLRCPVEATNRYQVAL